MKNKSLNSNTKKLDYYISLLNLSYDQAVEKLLLKYGPATDNYYREKSYIRFLNNEIKNITKGKYQRTKEGLFCHHIDELEFENLSDKNFIKEYRYSYFYHKKERLVYCDLIEHLILHTLIAKETNGDRGYAGYITYIRPMVNDFYVNGLNPKPEWMKVCKDKAYLDTHQINILLSYINTIISKMLKKQHMKTIGYIDLNRRLNLNMTIKQYREYKIKKQKLKMELSSEITKLRFRHYRIREKEKENLIIQQFYSQFPQLKGLRITPNTSRKEVLDYLFDYRYKNHFSKKKELRSFKINILKEGLFQELNSILENKGQK